MAELINLRQARKRRARAEKDAAAEANRRRHGRSGAETRATEAERLRDRARLDGHKRRASQRPRGQASGGGLVSYKESLEREARAPAEGKGGAKQEEAQEGGSHQSVGIRG